MHEIMKTIEIKKFAHKKKKVLKQWPSSVYALRSPHLFFFFGM